MRTPVLQTAVTLAFGGVLCTVVWLDRHRVADDVAAAGPGASDAVARFGFRLSEVSHQSGIDFLHHQATLDPQIATSSRTWPRWAPQSRSRT